MTRHDYRFLTDPIISSAIKLAELDIQNLPWIEDDAGYSHNRIANIPDGSKPGIRLSKPGEPYLSMRLKLNESGNAMVSWWKAQQNTLVLYLRYELDEEGGIVTIFNSETPEIMLEAMAGHSLKDIVDIPGADRMEIVEAVNSRAFISDPLDTRIAVKIMEPQS